ncbi:peptidyl-prolyl cis-trans isomerase [Bacteroides sp. OttesenSCG-928-J23]|nr:peptidyl-prolyl cis-trans isomerase [Bacteroides sp. OttesenSCG-928-J23]MDL2306230.1 peptidyl-prolyl cis-trans isomerase [Bacteroides sp. OttesenSCG-928-D19]
MLATFSLICASCTDKNTPSGRDLLVEINGNFLYKEDLAAVLPGNLTPDDSLLFAENYIRNWAENVLLYNVAKENIRDNEEIKKLIDNYSHSLIIHSYQQELVNQRLSPNISEEEITRFYENNRELFVLKKPLIKGLFIKVPLNAPQMNDLRIWYKTETNEAVDKLEKYSLLNAVSYDYFYDKWISVSDILAKIPLKEEEPEVYIRENRQIELKDTAFCYFLNVTEYLNTGDEEPYDFARLEAKKMLINIKRIDFMKSVKNDLYNEALRKNKIKFNY